MQKLKYQLQRTNRARLTTNAEITVATDAPIKPSHVFFGESLIKGVLPKKKPKKYAAMSLITISDAGRRNLHKYIALLNPTTKTVAEKENAQ